MTGYHCVCHLWGDISDDVTTMSRCTDLLAPVLGFPPTFFLHLLVAFVVVVSAADGNSDENIRHYGRELQAWLHDKGGKISDKLEIRRRDPWDPTSPSGVFATVDIPPGEIILQIPLHAYLSVEAPTVHDDKEEATLEAEMKLYYNSTCRLSKKLLEETRRYRESPTSSEFAPYIRYLEETQPMGQLPATYSPQAKDLLRRIQGMEGDDLVSEHYGSSPLPPAGLVDWIDIHFVQQNCFEPDDTETYHAVALAVQRGYDLEYIPIWDMVNHDVPERLNVETNPLRSPEGLVVKTTKAINAGDEILYTYNYCTDCYEMGDIWGTPGIYRDFGFLEDYPQYWPFQDQDVYVRIEQQSDGMLQAKFDEEDELEAEDVIFFKAQLERLQRIDIQTEIQSLTSSLEMYMTQRFYDSLKGALSAIIEAGEHLLNEEVQVDDSDDDDVGNEL